MLQLKEWIFKNPLWMKGTYKIEEQRNYENKSMEKDKREKY